MEAILPTLEIASAKAQEVAGFAFEMLEPPKLLTRLTRKSA